MRPTRSRARCGACSPTTGSATTCANGGWHGYASSRGIVPCAAFGRSTTRCLPSDRASLPARVQDDALRVALVHDWLTGMRGGEKVLEAICELFPDAPLYTLLHVPGSVSPRIEARRIVTSAAQHLP